MGFEGLFAEFAPTLGILMVVATVVLLGMVLLMRALLGTSIDDRIEAAGYRVPWKLALMGSRAPVIPVRAQLCIIATLVAAGMVAMVAIVFVIR